MKRLVLLFSLILFIACENKDFSTEGIPQSHEAYIQMLTRYCNEKGISLKCNYNEEDLYNLWELTNCTWDTYEDGLLSSSENLEMGLDVGNLEKLLFNKGLLKHYSYEMWDDRPMKYSLLGNFIVVTSFSNFDRYGKPDYSIYNGEYCLYFFEIMEMTPNRLTLRMEMEDYPGRGEYGFFIPSIYPYCPYYFDKSGTHFFEERTYNRSV